MLGADLESMRVLGQRTAELHLALASDLESPDFRPEAFTTLYQRSLYQSMRNLAQRTFELLVERRGNLPDAIREDGERLLARRDELLEVYRTVIGARLDGMRIRCHGDYHLGQVLFTGNDFVIIDFEGEPARSLGERRLKRSPLVDVAGMLRSFDYAAHAALTGAPEAGVVRPEDTPLLEPWAGFWRQWTSSAFLRAYLPAVQEAGLVPGFGLSLSTLLRVLRLDKSVYELGYELQHRPDWAAIPIHGLLDLLGSGTRRPASDT